MRKHLIIATRGSDLALWQANHVKAALEKENPQYTISLNVIKTKGDIIRDTPLAALGGKGLFVKEIEEALLTQRADLAVHSVKDVPMRLPDGLILGCVPKREVASDCFLSVKWPSLEELPPGASVGTCSLRRRAQLLSLRPDLRITDLRGNIDTRLRRLEAGDFDAVILATAGLYRLGLTCRYMQPLDVDKFIPAVGQGALGIECREDNYELLVMLAALEDRFARVCVSAERAFLRTLDGGCQAPIAAHARMADEESIFIEGLVGTPDGRDILRGQQGGDASLAEKIGADLGEGLLLRGAARLLQLSAGH